MVNILNGIRKVRTTMQFCTSKTLDCYLQSQYKDDFLEGIFDNH